MATKAGPKNITRGLVSGYDTGYPMSLTETGEGKYFRGRVVNNLLDSSTVALNRYNNPGFAGSNTVVSGEVHPIHGTRIYKLTHAASSGNESRLSSSEGFGCYHTTNTRFYPTAYYAASISFKPDPSVEVVTGSFHNGYSNVDGWGQSGTSRTIMDEGNGWYRMFTLLRNSTTSYSADGSTPLATRYAGNTYTTFELAAGTHTVSHVVDTAQYLGGDQYYRGTYQFVASLHSDINGVGASMTDWGIDSNMTKPTFNPVYNYPTSSASDINVTIYMRVTMPSAGSVQMRTYARSVASSISDSKYWKIYFDSSTVSTDKPMTTYWSAPFFGTVGSNSTMPGDWNKGIRYQDSGSNDRTISNNFKNINPGVAHEEGVGLYGVNARTISYDVDQTPFFDGTDDYIDLETPGYTLKRNFTFICWVKSNGALSVARRGIFSAQGMSSGYISFFGYTGGNGTILLETRDTPNTTYKGVGSAQFSLYDGNWHCLGFQIKANSIDVFRFDSSGNIDVDTSLENGTRGGFTFNDFHIGHDTSGYDWEGYIEAVRFYDKVLSQEELEFYYESTKKRFK